MPSFTPNKAFVLFALGEDTNTWGTGSPSLNATVFQRLDNMLGGRFNKTVTGGSYSLVDADYQNVRHVYSGALTSNQTLVYPSIGSLYLVTNNCTGNFLLNLQISGGSGIDIGQGQTLIIFTNPDAGDVEFQSLQGDKWAVAGGTSDAITATYNPQNTALVDGLLLGFRATAANQTTTPTFSPDGLTAEVITKYGGAALIPGGIPGALAECLVRYNLAHTRWELLNPFPAPAPSPVIPFPANLRSGFVMSTAGGSPTMTVGPGSAADSTNSVVMTAGLSIAKTTGSWASGAGNGGLDTGSVANNTGYHWYQIAKAGGQSVDYVFSLADPFNNLGHGTGPALPSTYTLWRWIGWGLTDGSGNWTAFTQFGNTFYWSSAFLDMNAVAPPDTNAHLQSITVPNGVNVLALGNVEANGASANAALYLSSPLQSDQAPNVSASPLTTVTAANIGFALVPAPFRLVTNTSAQLRWRVNTTSTDLFLATTGWEIPANANY